MGLVLVGVGLGNGLVVVGVGLDDGLVLVGVGLGPGVTVAGGLAPESPVVAWATTVTAYVVPSLSPVMVHMVAPLVVHTAPPGEAVAV